MEVRRAYCSAVDHMVPVVLRPAPARADPPAADRGRVAVAGDVDPADLYCLDYKVRCSGWCCPLFSTSDEPIQIDDPSGASSGASTAPPTDAGRTRRWTRRT